MTSAESSGTMRSVMATHPDTFKGVQQLVGEEAFARLSSASVCVVGLGGVGSWAVEALARSGVGALTLVDLDEVCVTNINRQVQATSGTIGRPKAAVLAERVKEIHPSCNVSVIRSFFSEKTASTILAPGFALVIDTIDRVENKALLLAECANRDLPVITAGAAGDRLHPIGVQVADLARTIHDPMLQIVRKELRRRYGFPGGERATFQMPCVYVPKQRNEPKATCEGGATRRSCNDGLGSAVFVTGAVGFAIAAEAVRLLVSERSAPLYPWKAKRQPFLERASERAPGSCAQPA